MNTTQFLVNMIQNEISKSFGWPSDEVRKGAFPNENSLLKLLFMGIKNAEKKWTMPVRNWSLTLSQLAIFFEGRLDSELKI